jgi:hypothetical protein
MVEAYSVHEKMRNIYSFLGRKSEGKRPLGRRRRRRKYNIKTNIRKLGFGDVDWFYMAHDRDWSWVMHLRVPLYAGNFLTSSAYL